MSNPFYKLENNQSEFPNVGNVNVYKYDNDFDYDRFNAVQMDLQLCSVPYDQGEAHVGQRTITGIGNVVDFGSKEARDKWFSDIPDNECFRWSTKYKSLHDEMFIDVPLPFDVAARHNYLVVHYHMAANDNSPVQYAEDTGLKTWFYFVRDVQFVAPNTTRLNLMDDAWQTWIYDINITSMFLERGHAPMLAMSAGEYLTNPIGKCDYLLTEDVNFGTASQVKHSDVACFNGNDREETIYACIATTANAFGSWGSKSGGDWCIPASAYYNQDGVPSVCVVALPSSDLNSFLTYCDTYSPQVKAAFQAVFFASSKLLTLGTGVKVFEDNFTLYPVSASRKTLDLTTLTKSQFGYDARYADIAKLYTSPYAHIEIVDENGNVDVIKIEDTSGTIKISTALSLAYPFVNIDAHLTGVGGTAGGTVTFKNVNSKSFPFTGTWYETLRTWKIPTFAVILQASDEYDFSAYFDRVQRNNEIVTQKTNADNLADMNYNNNGAMNILEKVLSDRNADLTVTLGGYETTANTASTTYASSIALQDSDHINEDSLAYATWGLLYNMLTYDNAYTTAMVNASQNASIQSSAISAAATLIGGLASVAISAGTGGALAPLAATLMSGGISSVASAAGTATAINQSQSQANSLISTNTNKDLVTRTINERRTALQNTANEHQATIQNALITANAAEASNVAKQNATTTKNYRDWIVNNTRTETKANNTRSYNTGLAGIQNGINQAALRAPFVYGSFSDGDSATTKPMALFANVVTQSRHAIRCAGDEFLKYGYRLDQCWPFDNKWAIGKYFTYWQVSDFWVYENNVPDVYMDMIRFYLMGGVTVWKHPEDIGRISIYDNR